MILLLGFAFLAGLVTILTPCMWPMLPIVLSSSVKGSDHRRALGVTIGVMISFAAFTLSISYLVRLFHFDPNILRLFAVVVIIFLGFSLIIPALTQFTEKYFSRLVRLFGVKPQQSTNDFKAGLLTGLTLGLVWSPCGGPILASIAVLAATGMVNIAVILVTLAYVIGVGLPLFIFTYAGQRFITRTRVLSPYTGRIQQVFGVIMILTAIAIYFNYDKLLQVKFLQAFPQLGQTLNGFESNNIVTKQLNALKRKQSTPQSSVDTSGFFNINTPAPDFMGITKWLNTDKPLTIADLKGKVVLVDFWTYTCINCIRSLPFVTSWYEKYKDQGFVVIGVHTPEFEFEKDSNNVLNAIKQYNIHYPVPQDNNYVTWNAYNNQYWPAEYLIDAKGNIRRTHFGEGEYDQTEMAIQALLKEKGASINTGLVNIKDQTPHTQQLSPETYLGSKRMQYYYPSGQLGNGQQNFTLSNPSLNSFSYGGQWNITDETAITGEKSVLSYDFYANRVYIILRPGSNPSGSAKVKVFLDNKLIDPTVAGQDVKDGVLTIDVDRLYDVVDLHGNPGEHLLRLEFQSPGVEAYTFTFG